MTDSNMPKVVCSQCGANKPLYGLCTKCQTTAVNKPVNDQIKVARCRIKEKCANAGRVGTMLGDKHFICLQSWTPVLWDDEDDPDMFKTSALEFYYE